MTKAELVKKLKEDAGLETLAVAEKAVEAVFAAIACAVKKGDTVAVSGFGSFKSITRAARKGRNPATGEEIAIPASTAVKFTQSKALKDAMK